MNISKINSFMPAKSGVSYNLSKKATNSINQNNSKINDSMNELIGRSLVVPFKGKEQDEFASYKFSVGQRGQADYNKKTGRFTITRTGLGSAIKSQEILSSRDKLEIFLTPEQGMVKKVTKTPSSTITQLFNTPQILEEHQDDSELKKPYLSMRKKEIYRLTEHDDGRSTLLRYDEDEQRKIHINRFKGVLQEAIVTDSKTGKKITSGDRILDVIFDEENYEEITKNLLTDYVVQKERFYDRSRKNIASRTVYYEKSNTPRYNYEYNRSKREATRKYFDKNGNMTEMSISAHSERSIENMKYNPQTGEMVEHTKKYFSWSNNKKVELEIIYNPENGDTLESIEHKRDHDIVSRYTNSDLAGENRKQTIAYVKNGKIYKFIRLRTDGDTYGDKIEINGLGEASYAKYDKNGRLAHIDYFTRKNKPETSIDYYPNSNRVSSVTKYNPDGKSYTQYLYANNLNKSPINIINVDADGNIKRISINTDGKKIAQNGRRQYENGQFDFEWAAKSLRDKSAIGLTRKEILGRLNALHNASNLAFTTRANNVNRIY